MERRNYKLGFRINKTHIHSYKNLWHIFVEIDENNIVTQVIVVANEDTTDTNGVEVEEIGVAFCKKLLGAETNWKQTSYNNNFRVRYAGVVTNFMRI
jgi:hypothetical protein